VTGAIIQHTHHDFLPLLAKRGVVPSRLRGRRSASTRGEEPLLLCSWRQEPLPKALLGWISLDQARFGRNRAAQMKPRSAAVSQTSRSNVTNPDASQKSLYGVFWCFLVSFGVRPNLVSIVARPCQVEVRLRLVNRKFFGFSMVGPARTHPDTRQFLPVVPRVRLVRLVRVRHPQICFFPGFARIYPEIPGPSKLVLIPRVLVFSLIYFN